jgi:tRNA(Ser,Leu) C12 N-acetylase TAN1
MNQVNINQRRKILKGEYIPKFTGISIILNNITKKSRQAIHSKQDLKN